MKKFILPVFSLLALVAGYLCLENHESSSVETAEFVVDSPYLVVLKGLASKDSLERIAESNDATVTDKNWESFQVEIPRRILRIREYKLDGLLRFSVEKTDRDLGKLKLPLSQEIHLEDQVLLIRTRLADPQKNVVSYEKVVEISPSIEDGLGQKTHVSIRSELKVRKTIPFFFGKTMDGRVALSNKDELERLKLNIVKISGRPLLTILFQGK